MCIRCNTTIPHKYTISGPHVKEICGSCGFYIKFTRKTEIPSVAESKALIWEITNDLKIIAELKLKLGLFNKEDSIGYHNLYVEILKHYFGDGK